MKKEFGPYYMGLDIGTNSVGWAVTDPSYKIMKFNGKMMWGIRLFEEASTAAATRLHRVNRRRIERASWRIGMLQQLLAPMISSVDQGFFQRLRESNLHVEDKSPENRFKFSLFSKGYMSDKEYYEKYPTIFHLRLAQLRGEKDSFDPRLLYMTLAHFVKNRGHFLFDSLNSNVLLNSSECGDGFIAAYDEMVELVRDNISELEDCSLGTPAVVMKIMSAQNTVSGKKKLLEAEWKAAFKNKQIKTLAGLLSGGKIALSDLFNDESLKESEVNKLSFKDGDYDEKIDTLMQVLHEKYDVIAKCKAIYDLALLTELMQGKKSVAEAKVDVYEAHKLDLKILKNYVKGLSKELFAKIFGIPDKEKNYSAYIGSCLGHNSKKCVVNSKKISQEELCDFIRKQLKDYIDFTRVEAPDGNSSELDRVLYRIKCDMAFPKLRTKDNGVIPNQLLAGEMNLILTNAVKYHPELAQKDDTGLTVAEKIIQIMEFKIPYYVGPLAGTEISKRKGRCWVVRKSGEKVTPWNFTSIVDEAATAECFIKKMTNKCSYIYGEDVLPKHSLLYSEFTARNELNNLRVYGEHLSSKIIQHIYDDLLVGSTKKLRKGDIVKFLKRHNYADAGLTAEAISGVDDVLQASLKSYNDFVAIFGREHVDNSKAMIEDVILWLTLFSDEKKMLERKIREKYPQLQEQHIKAIKRLKYTGWGRLSRRLLDSEDVSFFDSAMQKPITVIGAMRRESLNLMQLLSDSSPYGFMDRIQECNMGSTDIVSLTYQQVEELAVSPAIKRAVWQTIQIVKEIKKVAGHEPEKIFIEVARGGEAEKKRTISRKNKLLALYEACKKEAPELYNQQLYDVLQSKDDAELRSKKLYLYFTQMGRCMYSGKPIDIAQLYSKTQNTNVYDCDHIYPRAKTKDDSLDNLVLVHYQQNRDKSDSYPLSPEIQKAQQGFWQMLLKRDMISHKKYDRLIRKTQLSEDELAAFINRQLVEVRQSTKAVAELLKIECKDTKIVYSKAENISDFRQLYSFVKCREVNDLHHAKDAYLNIVVGNAFYTKFTDKPVYLLKNRQDFKYSLKPEVMFGRPIVNSNNVAWTPGEAGSIQTVRKMMRKNSILYTRMQKEYKGTIYNATIYKAGDDKLQPVKKNLPIEKYGGYKGQSTAYFALVESLDKKGNSYRSLEAVPVSLAQRIAKDGNMLTEYLKKNNGLLNPKIILARILLQSLLCVDGSSLHISGTTGYQITGSLATQLVLSAEEEAYIKRIGKIIARLANDKGAGVYESDGITADKNLAIYDILTEKNTTEVYKNRPAQQLEKLRKGRTVFSKLSIVEQCTVIYEVLKMFANKPVLANLSSIGGAGKAGNVQISNNLSRAKAAVLINQSITGLFQREINLLKI